ncbi:hypothetical protein G7Y89_g9216 [Cudoniella acicularis]|uniref:Uncharacterized protein n=1 Tax=Cudoniella acicularis TaxID=354080 RepID=A0A8H4RHB1_9HELO|nr:hypothetical protein G7Y89_g9216 [Cudoniella acicularis]
MGHRFQSNIIYNADHPIDYWKAQLAFRGWSPRGSKLGALKDRLKAANTTEMDPLVLAVKKTMRNEWRKQNKWVNRVVDRRMAISDPERFLRDTFYNDRGQGEGGPPVVLKNLGAGQRQKLHAAADYLFHEASISGYLLNLQNLKRKRDGTSDGEKGKGEDEEEEEEEVQDKDSVKTEEGKSDDEWDITGEWELECPSMVNCFGQCSPYAMTIFKEDRRARRELCGRFDFGEFQGIFRFSTQTGSDVHRHKRHDCDIDEFLLDADGMPSAENPTRYYRWRGKSNGEDVIKLGSDSCLYKMIFSNGGKSVKGTWGTHNSDPGNVKFQGVKAGDLGPYTMFNIQDKWDGLNQAAHDKANRNRWRR